jgi:hypothetical protein
MEKKVKWFAKGYCYGNYWGGGKGAYKTTMFTADSEEALREKISKAIDDGSIDSGMGYESMIGAIMEIRRYTTIEIDGDEYHNNHTDIQMFGDLSESDQDFLMEVIESE